MNALSIFNFNIRNSGSVLRTGIIALGEWQATSRMLSDTLTPVLERYKVGVISGISMKSITLGSLAPVFNGTPLTKHVCERSTCVAARCQVEKTCRVEQSRVE